MYRTWVCPVDVPLEIGGGLAEVIDLVFAGHCVGERGDGRFAGGRGEKAIHADHDCNGMAVVNVRK